MAVKIFWHKWQKVVSIYLLVIIGIVLLLALFINLYWSPILASKVKSTVLTSSDGLYKADFSNAELHILQGKIVIYNITLKPDTAVYNQRLKQHIAPNNLFELHVKKLVLSHIHPFKLYFEHELDIDKIILSAPEVHASYQLNHTRDTVVSNLTPWQKISKSLKSIHIGEIALNDVKFKYEDYSGNKVAISELKELNLSATDLLIDSTTQNDRSRLLYCKDIVAELNNFSGKSSNRLYSYKIKYLRLSTRTSRLNAEGIVIQPIRANKFFNKSNNDRFTLDLSALELQNFDFVSYHKYRKLRGSKLILTGGTFSIFSNPFGTAPKTDRASTFPQVGLRKLKMNLTIDTVQLHGINVIYNEYNTKSKKTGTLSFNKINGDALNITNDKTALQKNNICTITLAAAFMDAGDLKASLIFNLTDSAYSYSYKGSLGTMDLQKVNDATMALGMVKITSGTVNSLNFDLKGNRKKSGGNVTLLYNDLKVSLLKMDTTNNVFEKNLLASIFANTLILKHNNPDVAGGQPRSFNVAYQRPYNSPFFKTAWITLLKGIKPCAGLDEKTEKRAKVQMDEHELQIKQRPAKKLLRQQKRAERKLKRALRKQREAIIDAAIAQQIAAVSTSPRH